MPRIPCFAIPPLMQIHSLQAAEARRPLQLTNNELFFTLRSGIPCLEVCDCGLLHKRVRSNARQRLGVSTFSLVAATSGGRVVAVGGGSTEWSVNLRRHGWIAGKVSTTCPSLGRRSDLLRRSRNQRLGEDRSVFASLTSKATKTWLDSDPRPRRPALAGPLFCGGNHRCRL